MIKLFSEINKNSIQEVGGKGASLGEMSQAGLPIPPGFVVTTKIFQDFFNQELPNEIKQQILTAFDSLGAELVAVRSSAVAEDSSSASWAGQMESYLNVTKDQLIDRIRDCWNSIRSERALAYAANQGIPENELSVAVVVQKMVESEASGVMFTINPINQNNNEMMIEAGFGLGEYLVQGIITPDNYVLDKDTLHIKSKDIQKQEVMLVYKDSTNTEVALSEDISQKAALTENQVKELAKIGLKIEGHYGQPQDIEWALEKGIFYIVQSRPITTLALKNSNSTASEDQTPILKGLAASHGVATGKVRVVKELSELNTVEPGDILVTIKTTPDFVQVFGNVKAIITDQGGITSHAAIVSRELGIPAIVGTKDATTILINGQIVTVDGGAGSVYEGEVELTAQEVEILPIQKLGYSGDDIEDLLSSIALSVNDASELWPLAPGQFIPYYDTEKAVDMYHKLQKLMEDGKSLEDIARMFKHPTSLRLFMLDSGLIGFKAGRVLKIAPVTLDDQLKFTQWIIDLLRVMAPDDPLCLKGTNLVWNQSEVDDYLDKAKWIKLDKDLKQAINLLSVNLISYVWAFFWDYYPDAGFEVYGPYKLVEGRLGEDCSLLIKDYFDLKPDEVWPVAKKSPFKRIVLSQSYDREDIFLSYGNRVANKDSFIDSNHYFSLEVDGEFIIDRERILEIAQTLADIAKEQVDFVNKMEGMQIVRKGAHLAYYALKDFYLNFDQEYYPKDRIEAIIQKLGDQFLVKNKTAQNRTIEEKKQFFDPRNEFL